MKRIIKIIITFYYKCKFITKCKIYTFSNVVLRNCQFEGKNTLGKNTYLSNTSLGFASYIGKAGEFSNCIIGRFCSIGGNVRVVSATHPLDSIVSSYPSFYSIKFNVSFVKSSKFIEHLITDKGYECEIGNDVWIGDDVLIKGGVTIGDGAVVGMGSIILHDIPPYTIVAGIPAKPIRQRFNDDIVSKLLVIKWWNKPLKWIINHAEEFSDPFGFVNTYSNIKK